MKIEDTVAIVTGGASGLGEATTRTLVGAGGKVMILDRDNSPGPQVAKELGANVGFTACDVTSADQVEAAVAATVKQFGAVHIAVNCAGVGMAMRTITRDGAHPLDMFAKAIEVNLIGTFNVIRLAAWQMSKNTPNDEGERGLIVNTASVAAFDGQIGQAAYSASKGGIVGMTLPIARDLASIGIRVLTIAPGTFDTPMLAMAPEAIRQALGKQIPFPSRLGRPSEFAALVKHMAENVMLNGETIRLDGAIRMAPK
ncbi:MAG TPA: 3-hydroxyacyl-CoA dehydrogenase [Candidatus Binatia bacterium]|jgi:NAD(P)-dependent dehydrogenase (short-subunit alcohol dehydrogenase family)|nr:3-hydroxyacyl-CoA dehydrogenase [Candidatus Binatia bacterium]